MTKLEKVQAVLTDVRIQRRSAYVQGFQYGEEYVIRDVLLDWPDQVLYRTKHRCCYEKRLELEQVKFTAKAILDALGIENDDCKYIGPCGWKE